MKRFLGLIIVVFVAANLLSAPDLYAKCDDTKSCEKGHKVWEQLNLTPAQKKQLEDNKTKNREAMKATFEKIKSLKESMKAELMRPELDMNKINGIQSQIKSLHGQMEDARLNSILEVRKIMSQEQFEKFLELVGKHKQRGHKHDNEAQEER